MVDMVIGMSKGFCKQGGRHADDVFNRSCLLEKLSIYMSAILVLLLKPSHTTFIIAVFVFINISVIVLISDCC